MTFASPDDPYRDRKKYHYSRKFGENGEVFALCFKTEKKIDLNVSLWTIRKEAVTCKKCLKILGGISECLHAQ